MEGLAKVAWTYKKIRQASQAGRRMQNEFVKNNPLSENDISEILQNLKRHYGIDAQFIKSNDEIRGVFIPNSMISKLKNKPGVRFENYAQHFDETKDGVVIAPEDLYAILHELGHGVDMKNNPLLNSIGSRSRAAMEIAPFFGGLSTMGGVVSNETENQENENDWWKPAAIGTGLGAGVSLAGGAFLQKNEDAANDFVQEYLQKFRGMSPEEAAEAMSKSHIPHFRRTYSLHNKVGLRNALIGGGLGTIGGLGLSKLVNRKNAEEAGD